MVKGKKDDKSSLLFGITQFLVLRDQLLPFDSDFEWTESSNVFSFQRDGMRRLFSGEILGSVFSGVFSPNPDSKEISIKKMIDKSISELKDAFLSKYIKDICLPFETLCTEMV